MLLNRSVFLDTYPDFDILSDYAFLNLLEVLIFVVVQLSLEVFLQPENK